jgi:ribosome-binding protein aMBF1 (putative translation factor)
MKWLSKFKQENITEANDYKRTRQYNKLTPKMKRAVDMVFRMADKSADVIKDFEKNVDTASKQYGVSKNDLMNYFDKETLTILRR